MDSSRTHLKISGEGQEGGLPWLCAGRRAAAEPRPAGKVPPPGCGLAAGREERDGEARPGPAAPAARSSSQQPLF